jgi:RNA polymerase sigma factor (sigma-70 family)
VVRQYGGRLAAKARWSLQQFGVAPRADQVEEVVQEVYCRLLDDGGRRLRACRAESEGQAVSYLSRVVERVVIDQVRKRLAAKRGGGRTVPLGPEERRLLADPAGNPEDRLLAAERRRLVLAQWRHIGNEMQGQRNLRILRLALIEGWSSREIARSLGKLAPSSVDSVVHRLRCRLSDEGLALPRRPPNFGGLRGALKGNLR